MIDPTQKPSNAEILDELERVLQSDDFQRSERLSAFLRYVVEKSLEGEEDELKGYTIGVEVLEKPDDFDPDIDSSVRVQAIRLRKTLKLYYHAEGQDNLVEIRIPKGAYKPAFSYNLNAAQAQKGSEAAASLLQKFFSPWAAIVLIGLFALGVFLAGYYQHFYPHEVKEDGYYKPLIAVLPIETIGTQETTDIGNDLRLNLADSLLRFSEFKTYDVYNLTDAENKLSGYSSEISEKLGIDFVLEGSLQQNFDSIDVIFRLIDGRLSHYIWTYTETFDVPAQNTKEFIASVTEKIVPQIASPHGILMSYEKDRVENLIGRRFYPYRCMLDYYFYSNNKSQARYDLASECLHESIKMMPDNADNYSYLSWLYGDIARYSYTSAFVNPKQSAKELSFETARRAIQISPLSPRAHQYLSNAAALNQNFPLALTHMKMALSLNPYDSDILADAAWLNAKTGDWEKSRAYAEKAIANNPGHPRWYYGVLFIYHYREGNYEEALSYARDYYQTDNLLASLALCAANSAVNKTDEARELAEKIEQKFPEFVENPFLSTKAWQFDEEFYEKFLIGLRLADIDID